MNACSLLSADLGDGVIDNIIVDSRVHLVVGVLVLVSMTTVTGLSVFNAIAAKPPQTSTKAAALITQIVLAAQVLLGIKLLDQGQGISQLYIHYVGGLIPLGAFLAGSWVARKDTVTSSRIMAGLLSVAWLSASMAFFVGRSYVAR